MVKLSVIIVNYNVRYFLEIAIESCQKAIDFYQDKSTNQIELIVVDNCSKDGSVQWLQKAYPNIKLIANTDNKGFSKANNQGIDIAKGEYVLLLNPDTLIQQNTLQQCIQFMDEHKDAGGLGIKMIDGTGQYLPESKRGLPTPLTALYKMTGAYKLFPKSAKVNRYYQGHLSKDETNSVEILSGAFMMMRKNLLDEIGGLDEDYFMYGEDIDQSYKIIKAGYKNYYFAENPIIHFKGESTKKGSLNYVRIFYNAMLLFAQKHFNTATWYVGVIKLGIYFRAALAVFSRMVKAALPYLFDTLLIVFGFILLKDFWAANVKNNINYYDDVLLFFNLPIYLLVWVVSVFFSGGYDPPYKNGKLIRGLLFGTLIISAIYGFLDESYRFSRSLILLGGIWAYLVMSFNRWGFSKIGQRNGNILSEAKNSLVLGNRQDFEIARQLFVRTNPNVNLVGFINETTEEKSLGQLNELDKIVHLFNINELIFSMETISAKKIIASMEGWGNKLAYKIMPSSGSGLIGSNSKNTAGDLLHNDVILKIRQRPGRRNKRVLDLVSCIIMLPLMPLLLLLVEKASGLLPNWWAVLTGKKSWVGKVALDTSLVAKKGIISPLDRLDKPNTALQKQLIFQYAKEYSVYKDISLILAFWRELGRQAKA